MFKRTAAVSTVDVYFWSLDPPDLEELTGLLDPEERARADRFLLPEHGRRFRAARGQLRRLLAAETGRPASDLELAYAEHGKPYLPRHPELSFNLSHSHEGAVCAVCRGAAVGVDLEWTLRRVEFLLVGRRFFSAPEVRKLDGTPEERQREVFFNCWTRKEAYIKALGDGLARPLDSFGVGMLEDEPPALLWSLYPGELERWSLYDLGLPSPYKGALVVEGRDWQPVIRTDDLSGAGPDTRRSRPT